jgi:hypothetical protein
MTRTTCTDERKCTDKKKIVAGHRISNFEYSTVDDVEAIDAENSHKGTLYGFWSSNTTAGTLRSLVTECIVQV